MGHCLISLRVSLKLYFVFPYSKIIIIIIIIIMFFFIFILGLEEEAKLPEDLAGLVHKLVVIPVLNPVKVTK